MNKYIQVYINSGFSVENLKISSREHIALTTIPLPLPLVVMLNNKKSLQMEIVCYCCY